jgi:hypothetical protein
LNYFNCNCEFQTRLKGGFGDRLVQNLIPRPGRPVDLNFMLKGLYSAFGKQHTGWNPTQQEVKKILQGLNVIAFSRFRKAGNLNQLYFKI